LAAAIAAASAAAAAAAAETPSSSRSASSTSTSTEAGVPPQVEHPATPHVSPHATHASHAARDVSLFSRVEEEGALSVVFSSNRRSLDAPPGCAFAVAGRFARSPTPASFPKTPARAAPPAPPPSPPRLSARLSAYRSSRYSADFASGDGGEDDGGVVDAEATPPRPHARHAVASAKTRLSTPNADASLACPAERCTGLASLSAALHAWHFPDEPGIEGAASIRRTDDASLGGDPDTRCDSSTAKLSFGLNPRDRARDPLPIAPTRPPPSPARNGQGVCPSHFLRLDAEF
jgi:hypothetical protein